MHIRKGKAPGSGRLARIGVELLTHYRSLTSLDIPTTQD